MAQQVNKSVLLIMIVLVGVALEGCGATPTSIRQIKFQGNLVWNLNARALGDYELRALAINTQGTQLACGTSNGKLLIWAIRNEEPSNTLSESSYPVERITFSADNRYIAWICREDTRGRGGAKLDICVFDQVQHRTVRLHKDESVSEDIGFTPDSQWLTLIIGNGARSELLVLNPTTLNVEDSKHGFYTGVPRTFILDKGLGAAIFDQLFIISGPSHIDSIPLPYLPDAITSDAETGIYSATPQAIYFSSLLGRPGSGMLVQEGGLFTASLRDHDNASKHAFQFDDLPRSTFHPLLYTRSLEDRPDWLLGELISSNGVISSLIGVDRDFRSYQSFPDGGYWAVSGDGSVVATGNNQSRVSLWKMRW